MKKVLLIIVLFSLVKSYTLSGASAFEITSSAFEHNKTIPQQYSCDGADISPPLSWSGIPGNTKSLALIVDDPDAPGGTWVHWIVYNILPTLKELQENIPPLKILPDDTKQGINDFKEIGYGGPCPPSGTHRYFFRLYALNTKLNLAAGVTKRQLKSAMKGHIIAQAKLIGKYKQ